MSDDDLDRPEESTSADVTLITKGVTVTALVEVSSTGTVVVRPTGGGPGWQESPVQTGDAVELYWVGGEEERTLGGKISRVDGGSEPRWHVAVKGQAQRSQRRKAVRARIELEVLIPWAGAQMTGTTVDLSESGMRALMDGWGVPPLPGTPSQVSLTLEDALVHLHGEFIWTSIRGAQWLLAMQFVDVPDKAATSCGGGSSRHFGRSEPPRGADPSAAERVARLCPSASGALACRSPAGGADPGPQLRATRSIPRLERRHEHRSHRRTAARGRRDPPPGLPHHRRRGRRLGVLVRVVADRALGTAGCWDAVPSGASSSTSWCSWTRRSPPRNHRNRGRSTTPAGWRSTSPDGAPHRAQRRPRAGGRRTRAS